MFELDGIFTSEDSPKFALNNLSIYYHDVKDAITYASFLSNRGVNLISWNEDLETTFNNLIYLIKEENNEDEILDASNLMQTKICMPSNKLTPILVILAIHKIIILDIKTKKILFSLNIIPTKTTEEISSILNYITYGISCVENLIMIGTNSGEIYLIACNGEKSFQKKKILKEHNNHIISIATCLFDGITVSGDVSGNVCVWSENMRKVTKRIETKTEMTALNILRKNVLCATYVGRFLIYSITTGLLMADVHAHARQINSINVAVASAYILTASEDSNIRIWKLHTRKPDPFQVEFRYSQKFENMSIVGADFSGIRGNCFIIAVYENNQILRYKIARKKTTQE